MNNTRKVFFSSNFYLRNEIFKIWLENLFWGWYIKMIGIIIANLFLPSPSKKQKLLNIFIFFFFFFFSMAFVYNTSNVFYTKAIQKWMKMFWFLCNFRLLWKCTKLEEINVDFLYVYNIIKKLHILSRNKISLT